MKNPTVSTQLKKTGPIVVLEIVVAVVISGLLIMGLIVPQYQSWRKAVSGNKETKTRLEKVSNNVEILSALKASEFKKLNKTLALILPEEEDSLRFVSLAENIAAVSGVNLLAAQVQLGGGGKS